MIPCYTSDRALEGRSSTFLRPRKAPKPDKTATPYVAPVEYPVLSRPGSCRSCSSVSREVKKTTFRRRVHNAIRRGILRSKSFLLCSRYEPSATPAPRFVRVEREDHHDDEITSNYVDEKAEIKLARRVTMCSFSAPPSYRISEISLAPTYRSTTFPLASRDSSTILSPRAARDWLNTQSTNTWMSFLSQTVFESNNEQDEIYEQVEGRCRDITMFPDEDARYSQYDDDDYVYEPPRVLTSRFSSTTIASTIMSPTESTMQEVSKHMTWPMRRGDETEASTANSLWIMSGIQDKTDLQKRLAEYLDERMEDYAAIPVQNYGYI